MTESEKPGTGLATGRLGSGQGLGVGKLGEGAANRPGLGVRGGGGGGEFRSEYRTCDGGLGDTHEEVSWAQRGQTARASSRDWYVVDQGSGPVF